MSQSEFIGRPIEHGPSDEAEKRISSGADAERQPEGIRLLLIFVIMAQVTIGSDYSVASIAIPSIERALGLNLTTTQWVLTADLVVYAGSLIVAGRMADAFGQRVVLCWGMALFMLGSALSSLSFGPGLLIASRAIQGLGGALGYTAAFSFITVLFPPGPERFRALTISMASQAVGVPLFTIFTGWAINHVGWRGAFLLNVPFSTAIIAGSLLSRSAIGTSSGRGDIRIPMGQAVMLTIGVAALIYAIVAFVGHDEAARALAPTVSGAALLFLAAFVLVQRSSVSPLIPPALLRTFNFKGGITAMALMVFSGKVLAVLSNISLQRGLHFSALQTSYALLPMALSSALLVPLAPYWTRILLPHPKRSLMILFSFLGAMYFALGNVPASAALPVLLMILFLAPFASVNGVNLAAAETLKEVASEDQGCGTAIMYMMVQLVSAVGMAIVISASARSTNPDDFLRFNASFFVAAAVCVIGVIAVWLILHVRTDDRLPVNVAPLG